MERKKIKIKVFAKVNLSLNILGVRENMHELDMVLTSVDIADVISVYERLDDKINVEFSSGERIENNTALKAASLICSQFGALGADIFIEKGIPVGAGLGGSSADAAGVIYAFDKIFDLSLRGFNAPATALKAGSDVPYMLKGGFARVKSTGKEVETFNAATQINLVVCMGDSGVSTKESYAKFDEMYEKKKLVLSDNDALISSLVKGDINGASKQFANALYLSSAGLNPSILYTMDELKKTNPVAAVMSGSGSACIGVYADSVCAQNALKELSGKGLFCRAVVSKRCGIEEI